MLNDDTLIIGRDELCDQRERMVEEYGLPPEQAEEAFTEMKTQVSLQAQEMGKDWDDDVLEEVTNLVIGIQQQEFERHRQRKANFYDRLYNLLAGALIAATAMGSAVRFYQGYYAAAVVVFVALLAILYVHTRHA